MILPITTHDSVPSLCMEGISFSLYPVHAVHFGDNNFQGWGKFGFDSN